MNLIVKDTTGTIYLQSTRIDFESEDGEQIAHFISDGAVELYHDNNLRLQTWSDGVNIHGDEGQSGMLQELQNAEIGIDYWSKIRTLSECNNSIDYYLINYRLNFNLLPVLIELSFSI